METTDLALGLLELEALAGVDVEIDVQRARFGRHTRRPLMQGMADPKLEEPALGTAILAAVCLFFLPALSPPSGATTPTSQPARADVPVDAIFVIDNSGSMRRNDPDFITHQVVMNFAAALSPSSRLGMVVFDRDARLVQSLTAVGSAETQARLTEKLRQVDFSGQLTHSPAGIERALYDLKENGRPDAEKVVIFLTDGIIDTGDEKRDREVGNWLLEDLALEARRANIRIFGIAFTDQVDFQLIQTLTLKTNGAYFRAYRAEEIPGMLSRILAAVREPGDRQLAAREIAPAPGLDATPAAVSAGAEVTGRSAPDEASEKSVSLLSPVVLLPLAALLAAAAALLLWSSRRETNPLSGPGPSAERKPGLLPAKKRKPVAQLIDVTTASSDGVLPLAMEKNRLSVGRDPNNDVVIRRSTISSFHATIDLRDGYFYLEDHRSTNGTRLNEEPLLPNQPVQLKSGDRIDFANCEFRFLIPEHVPSGKTVILGPSKLSAEVAPPAPQPVPRPKLASERRESSLFRRCLEQHLQKIAALGPRYRTFVEQKLSSDLIAALVARADELMKQCQADGKGRHEIFPEKELLFVLCVIPDSMDNAADWFRDNFGGFSKLLGQLLESHHFTELSAKVLCVITYGESLDAWVSVTIAPADDNEDPIDIMSVELLSPDERRALALRFNEIGQIV